MQEHVYKEEVVNGFNVKIVQDNDPMSPRDWDNLGTMTCFHSGYNLGDEQERDAQAWLESMTGLDDEQLERLYLKVNPEFSNCSQSLKDYHDALIETIERDYLILPLYLYDHSGITISTSPFSCRWDSGQVGFIWVSKADIRKAYRVERISPKLKERVLKYLNNEVETYDQYLTGEVYGYIIGTEEDEHIESCWGFFGDEDHCFNEALSTITYMNAS